VAAALARAGVGQLVIADYDRVETANLERQYYFAGQVGERKVEALAPFRHTFSHFHLDITPLEIPVQIIGTRDSNGRWVDPAAPGELGLAAPVKKLLGRLDTPRQTSML
jgi:A/G-specific adenine glycosylase